MGAPSQGRAAPPPAPTTLVRILGPVAVTVAGAEVALGSPKQRAVFAVLAMSSGHVVSTDRLVSELWGDDPPESAASTLQVYISRLRRSLGEDLGVPADEEAPRPRVLRRAPGYVLEVADDAVDARRFARLLADARAGLAVDPDAALRGLDEALALVSGAPLADVVELLGDAAVAEAARLAELVLLAREARLSALLSLGDAPTVATTASALVELHPFRESLHALLILALYRDGRQAEALAVYDRVRRRLDDELGVEPGRALRALHAQVLQHDLSLEQPGEPEARPAPVPRNRTLPEPVTALIGRDDELAQVAEALTRGRLVTVVGPGGIGKTRLVLEAARSRGDADGPWFVDLAGLEDGSLLLETVVTALAISGAHDAAGLADVLGGRRLVLVLDNCEQIAAEVARLVTLVLERCPDVRVLATSRQTLGVPGERVLELRTLASADAERLFVERATAVVPGWRPDPHERATLARVCRGLDDLPLAIELAAAQCRALSVDQLADQLGDRFALLSGGGANVRHASMSAAVGWSYDALSSDEKALFQVLSVFEGSFDLEGATAVAGGRSVLSTLLSLIDKSLVTALDGSPRRYRILETLRQYAALQRSDERTRAVRRQIVAWAANLADQTDAELRGPRSRQWMHRLEQDKDTVRAALSWSVDGPGERRAPDRPDEPDAPDEPDGPDAHDHAHLRIAVGMVWFWYRRGHVVEALRALESGPPTAQAVPDHLLIGRSIGVVLLRYLAGDYASLVGELGTAAGLAARTQDSSAKSYALSTIAFFEANLGPVEQAVHDARTALELARGVGSPQRAADALLALSTGHLRAGDLDEARARAAEGVAVAEDCGYSWCVVACEWVLAKAGIAAGDFAEPTRAAVARVIGISVGDRDLTSWVVGVVSAAYVLLRRGDVHSAAELAGIAHRQGRDIGYAPELMDPLDTAGYLSELTRRIADEHLTATYDAGRALDPADAFARVAELVPDGHALSSPARLG
ncbi:BTAD domain-containing putative transcriptional regulator [Cellulomonas sp. URHE0023]|uniref:BTAD domain-containing putative transcriptional regulator n=1 Tax=Cellulomonas sp. URHE0023 TaxID=1380354 RepID=UPI000691749C|nr:BTAD domain-containing putative transcriptional regulator [Cellulomonas sp. URHE0023]